MTEREIFAAALDLTDPQARQVYLDRACAGNPELRRQVEELLVLDAVSDDFLSTPAIPQLTSKSTAIEGEAPAASSAEFEQTHGYTQNPDTRDDDISLDFLSPSEKPGSLGRLGHYEIHEVLGHGAFGIVLKAFDEKLHRMVAIKVMSPELASTSPPRKRFLREARAAAAIRHENVVAVHAVEEQPLPYLVMEYIPGITLHQALDEHGPLDVADVLRLGQQIASGLAAAHTQGLIHRDIKPSNILLENGLSGKVKITDFGLARAADDANQTQSGMIAGTPMYMSPEQATGGGIDQRSDLFSLGSVLYVMLSGRPPFRATTTLATLQRVAEGKPRPIPEIIADAPDWLCAIIAKLQAKSPDDRFGSAQEVADLLGRCLADLQANRPVQLPEDVPPAPTPATQSTETEPVAAPSELSPPSRRQTARRWPAVAAAAILLLLSLGFTEATGVTQLTSTVIRLTTGSGTLVIETDDPSVQVTIDGEEVRIQGTGVQQLTLKPGQYQVATVKDGQPVSQQLVTITRGGREVVRVTMEGHAAHVQQAAKSPSESSRTAVTQPVVELSPWDLLDAAQIPANERVPGQPEGLVAVLGQHRRRTGSSILSTSVSPDGTQFLSTTDDGLYLFGGGPRQPARFFSYGIAHPSATFLPDGRIAASVADGMVNATQLLIFAKPREGVPLERQTATILNTPYQILHATASSDGHWLAGYDYKGDNFSLWRLGDAPPQRAAKFPARFGNINPGSFSLDAHWFCFTDRSDQSAVHLIDLRGDTPREAAVLKADADEPSDAPAKNFEHAAFLSDGRLATADRNGRTWFWNINDGTPQRVGSLRDTGWIYPAAQSSRCAIYGESGFRIWDLAADPPQLLGRSSSSPFVNDNVWALAMAPNGETVVTGHLNGAVRFWNVTQAGVTELDPLVPNPKTKVTHGGVEVVDRFLCSTMESSRVSIWRPTRAGLQALPEESPALWRVLNASPAQRQLVALEPGGVGTALLRFDGDRVTPTRRINGSSVHSAALNDEGRRLAIARHNGTEEVLELWGWESDDLPARKLSEIKSLPYRGITQLAFAEAGRVLVGRFGNHSIQIWDVKDDQLTLRTTLPPRQCEQFAVAPEGQTLATVNGETVELWDLKSDLVQPIASFAVHGSYNAAVAFSPDGQRLAASFWEKGATAGVQIIDLAKGVVEKRLTFPGPVDKVAFTDDGRHLVTGNANGTIYVVRLENVPGAAAAATQSDTGWHGWPKDAPKPAIAPFDAEQAKQHQEAWAAYLKVPVEYTNSLGMKFRLIPPGEFLMGSTPAEIEAALKDVGDDKHWQECIKSEAPQHKVILTQAIYLGVNEVTQAEYEKVMGTNPSHFAPMGTGKEAVAGMETTDHPVEMVSWNDAAEFCTRLSQQEKLKPCYFRGGETVTPLNGTGYRLPSEAEWEFACRAGTATTYWIGDSDDDLLRAGWFNGNSGRRTHAAGELKANPFGLYDIHGNVFEWVQDGWDASWYSQFQEKPAVNPNIPFSAASQRVIRGGNCNSPASHCRSSVRHGLVPSFVDSFIGFRVSLMVDAVKQALSSTPADDPDRRAAEWVLSVKGIVTIRGDGFHKEMETVAELPASPFRVTHVSLQDRPATHAGIEKLARLQEVIAMNLVGTPIGDSELALLKDMVSLQQLGLRSTLVTNEGLVHLKNLKYLTALQLRATQISDAGMEHFQGLRNLEFLELSACPVTDAGLEKLDKLTALRRLDVTETKVTETGVKKLAAALPKCRIEWDGGVIEPTADP